MINHVMPFVVRNVRVKQEGAAAMSNQRKMTYQWGMEEQFQKHDPNKDKTAGRKKYEAQLVHQDDDITALTPTGKVMATNAWGRPEGFFTYGSDRTTELEFACDIDMTKLKNSAGEMEYVATGLHALCPKCGSALYVKGKGIPGGREIVVHWEKMTRSNVDGKYRPLISVDGHIGCDYLQSEITGINESRSGANIINKCGWRGGIINGRCFDHTLSSGLGV